MVHLNTPEFNPLSICGCVKNFETKYMIIMERDYQISPDF